MSAKDILATMRRLKMPITRQSYINLAYGEEVPDPWTPEDETMLPEELQDWTQFEMDGIEMRKKR